MIKPSVYIVELILCAVVAIGTLDKLLFKESVEGKGLRCAFDDSMPTCIYVATAGFVGILGGFAVLWYRVTAAFGDSVFHYEDEAVACALLSLLWLTVASVISTHSPLPHSALAEELRTTRNVITAFSWITWLSYLISAIIAYFVPNCDTMKIYNSLYGIAKDEQDAPLHNVSFSSSEASAAIPCMPDGEQTHQRDEKTEEEHLRSLSLRKFSSLDAAEQDDSYSLGASTGTPVDEDSRSDGSSEVLQVPTVDNEANGDMEGSEADMSTLRRRNNRLRYSAPPFSH